MNSNKSKQIKGSFAYENWKAYLIGEPLVKTFEHPFYTDSHIIGSIPNIKSPYDLFLTFAQNLNDTSIPALILRREEYIQYAPSVPRKTTTERYHGGLDSDEIAALISLCLGIRMKSGMFNRVFEVRGDPKGQPMFFDNEQRPVLLKNSFGPVIPRTTKTHNLEDCLLIGTLPELAPEQSIALIRSARFYQDALWIADSETSLAWIMLVSAIETAASNWRKKDSPLDRLKVFKDGELYNLVYEKGGDEFAGQIANLTSDFLGSSKKFVDFILEFLPEPICTRENKYWWQHSWEKDDLTKSLKMIYGYRSKALHSGIPFPYPMCLPPRKVESNSYEETALPSDGVLEARGGAWAGKDTPMLLHVFEHIVRNCLLKWWQSLAKL